MQNPDIGAYVQRGRQAMMERRFDDAREIYQQILALDPAQPRAWLALSALAQSQGDFRESVRAVRSAVPAWKRSGSQQFITELSMRLLVLGEYKEARDLISSADWFDPIVLRYSMGLVQYLGLAEAHQEALDLADYAISKAGNPPAALLLARANALRYLGRMQEATEAYERCIALDPLNAEAHWTLAHHAVDNTPGGRLPRIRKAISHTQPSSEDAIYLHYALFKELDDAGNVEDAWRALRTGSTMKRARLRYEDAAWATSFEKLRQVCDKGFLHGTQAPQENGHFQHTPIFIVGLPRSGTTLLERMLGNHPGVMSAGELNDFPSQLAWEINAFIGELPGPEALNAYRDLNYASLGSGYLQRTGWRVRDADFLVDKLPNNFINAGFIHKALPNAKIICLRRGLADSCFSTFKHLFSGTAYPFSYDIAEMIAHYRRFDQLANHWQEVMPSAFLCVDYERLVNDTDDALRQVSDFCGLQGHAGLAAVERNTSPSATASTSQVRDQVHTRNIGSWLRYQAHLDELMDAVS